MATSKLPPERNEPTRLSAAAPLELRRHGGGTHLSLARQTMLRFIELAADVVADETDGSGDDLRLDATAASDPWYAGEQSLDALADPQQGLYLAGERHLSWFDAGSGHFIPVPGVQWHLGVATGTIAPGGSGEVEVWRVSAAGSEAYAARRVTAYDWLKGGAANGDRLVLFQHLQSRRWYFLAVAADSPASAAHHCHLVEVRLSAAATPATINSTTPVAIPFDEVAVERGGVFALAGGSSAGEVTVAAAGLAEIYHHDAANVGGTPSGENLTEWWIERKPAAAAGDFAVVEDTVARMHHPAIHEGGETKQTLHVAELAFGDTLRVRARRLAGGDALTTDTLAGGGPTCFLGIHFLCHADSHDHSAALTNTAGEPYDPSGNGGSGSGDQTLKLGGYYRLTETSSTADRVDFSGNGHDLRVLPAGTATILGVTGHVGGAAKIDGAVEFLNRGAFGDPEPELAFRPASQMVSVAFWITLDSLGNVATAATLVGLGDDDSWKITIDSSSNVTARCGQQGFMAPAAEAQITALPLAKPIFITAVFDGLRGSATIRGRSSDKTYDQTDTDTVASPTGWGAASLWHFDIGSTTPATWAEFTIEQFGLWYDRALTAQQAEFLFAAGSGRQLL